MTDPASQTAPKADPKADPKAGPKKTLRPRDAGTLLLVRTPKQGDPEVLMGLRHAKHSFMPNLYVFPGGGTDAADGRMPRLQDLDDADLRRLRAHTRASITDTRLHGVAMAAVRETFEETGFALGEATPNKQVRSNHDGWSRYFALGCAPNLSRLTFIARAITPPGRTRRFDARFFMAHTDALFDANQDAASGELENLRWFTFAQARALDLPSITRVILDIAQQHINAPNNTETHIPFFRFQEGKMARILIP